MPIITSSDIGWNRILRFSCLTLGLLTIISCSKSGSSLSSSLDRISEGEAAVHSPEQHGDHLPLFSPVQATNLYHQLIQQGNFSDAAILQSLQDFRPQTTAPSSPGGNDFPLSQNIPLPDLAYSGSNSETTLEGSWHTRVGWGFVLDGNYSAAEAAYRQALRQETNSAEAYLGLGMALMFQGKREQAILSYEEAIKIQPNNAAALVHLGYAYADSKETQSENRIKARVLFQQASDLGDPFAQLALRGLTEPGEGI